MNLEVLTSVSDLGSVAPRWDELAREEGHDGFFRTFSWYSAWLTHIRPDATPFVVVARDERGTIIGIAPLCRLVYRDAGFRLHGLAWGGREVVSGDFLGLVASAQHRRQVTDAVLRFVWEARSRWGVLVLGELLDESEPYEAIRGLGSRHALPVRRQEERICPYIALPASFEDFLDALGRSTRYHIRRRIRECEKAGATVVTYEQPDDIASRLDTLVRLHVARWNKANLPGTLVRKGFVPFLRSVLNEPPAGAGFRLYELSHEGATAASLLTFFYTDGALYYQAGWDPESPMAAHSPGVVLMAASVRGAIEHGLRRFEFLRGDEAYKSRWTKTYRQTSTLVVGRSWGARAYLQLMNVKDAVKARRSAAVETPTDSPDAVAGVQ
jgi:CelD/BcsL family acetyltransferase involved in cellulose biosynthesis